MAAIARLEPRIVGLSPRMEAPRLAPSAAADPRVLAESALAILLRRRNSGELAARLACRALARRWLAVARGAA